MKLCICIMEINCLLPFSLFSGLVSTPIILDAPLFLAICATLYINKEGKDFTDLKRNQINFYGKTKKVHILTDNPTVPKPKMATVDPLVTSATFQAAPKPIKRF